MGEDFLCHTDIGKLKTSGDIKRTDRGIKTTCVIAVIFAVAIGIILKIFGKYLMEAFNVNNEALQMGIRGLSFIAYFYVFLALQNVLSGALRGAGASTSSALSGIAVSLFRIPIGYFLAIHPLNKACQAAAELGQYATAALAEAAGVGMEHYFGLFISWGLGMVIGFLMILPLYLWGNWRSKGITDKAHQIQDS